MKKKEAKHPIPIPEWSKDERPREKLLKYGEHTPWNLFPACNLDKNGHIEVEYFNLLTTDGTIPLGICQLNTAFTFDL